MSDIQAIRVDIVSDVVCPWCAVGYFQLARAVEETSVEIDIHWHPFELNPQMAMEGEDLRAHLAAKYGSTKDQSEAARARLTALGADLGFRFEFGEGSRIWNTFASHQLLEWSQDHKRQHILKLALFEAYFTHGKNLADEKTLAGIAENVGLDGEGALELLRSERLASTVRRKQRYWIDQGIHGVPAMIFNGKYLVSGARGEAFYAETLRKLSASQAA